MTLPWALCAFGKAALRCRPILRRSRAIRPLGLAGTQRLLFKTPNSALWETTGFQTNYVALTASAAHLPVREQLLAVVEALLNGSPKGYSVQLVPTTNL